MDISINSIGMNKGVRRVWLQGKKLERAGFRPQTPYRVEKSGSCLVVTKKGVALRTVSSRKRDDVEIPIIDINNESLSIFAGMDQVRVIFDTDEIRIEPIASLARAKERIERVKKRIQNGESLKFGSLAHGGGVMDDAVEHGFSSEGVKAELHFANEIREDLTDHAMTVKRTWKEKTIALVGKLQEFAFDRSVLDLVDECDVLTAGLPCSGASISGRVKRKLALPEDHPEVGHLVVPLLAIVARFNPIGIVFENVIPYSNSASMSIMRTMLDDLHYELYEVQIDGSKWGALEHRKRMVMIAVTKGMELSIADLVKPPVTERPLADILEDIPLDGKRWPDLRPKKSETLRQTRVSKCRFLTKPAPRSAR